MDEATKERIKDIDKKYRKIFYKKASVYIVDDVIYLKSYSTVVASIKDRKFRRHWGYWSATTQRHVNEFLKDFAYNLDEDVKVGKAAWIKMAVCYE